MAVVMGFCKHCGRRTSLIRGVSEVPAAHASLCANCIGDINAGRRSEATQQPQLRGEERPASEGRGAGNP